MAKINTIRIGETRRTKVHCDPGYYLHYSCNEVFEVTGAGTTLIVVEQFRREFNSHGNFGWWVVGYEEAPNKDMTTNLGPYR